MISGNWAMINEEEVITHSNSRGLEEDDLHLLVQGEIFQHV